MKVEIREFIEWIYEQEHLTWSEILNNIPDNEIQAHSENWLNARYEDKCISEFRTDELKIELEARGFSVLEGNRDIVSSIQLKEMVELFLVLSPQKRQELINKLK